jgi:hypothetical protein
MYHFSSVYLPLSRFINLSQAAEITKSTANATAAADSSSSNSVSKDDDGDRAGDAVVQLRQGHPVTSSQTNLNKERYATKGDGIYAVAKVSLLLPFISLSLSLSY